MVRRLLVELDSAPPIEIADVLGESIRSAFPCDHVWLYLTDYPEHLLQPVPGLRLSSPPEPLKLQATPAGPPIWMTRSSWTRSADRRRSGSQSAGSYQDASVAIAGRLEPANSIGGDTFDYASNGSIVELAVFDAMGRGLQASTLAAAAISAYRNGRRRYDDLRQVAALIDETVAENREQVEFVTGLVARL